MKQNNHDRSFLPFKIIRGEKEQRFVALSSSASRETKVVLGQSPGCHHWVKAKHLFESQFLRTGLHRPKQKSTHFWIYLNRKNACDFLLFFYKFFEKTAPLFFFNVYNDTFQSPRYLAADRFRLSEETPASWQSAGSLSSNRNELHCRRHGELERWAGNKT